MIAPSAPTPGADAPAVASSAATDAVRAATEGVPANTGDIEPAAEPPALQTTAGAAVEGVPTEGELRITSDPAGALVTVNGVGWGSTPVTIRYMPAGKKLIRASKPGYVSTQRGLDFVPDRRARSLRIQLSPESPEAR